MTRQVQVSRRAQSDVVTILTWLHERSPQGAARWFDKYLDTLQELPDRAEGCAQAPEAALLGRDLRQMLFKTRRGHTYRSVFVIAGDFIQLLAVRGAGQDLLTAEDVGLD